MNNHIMHMQHDIAIGVEASSGDSAFHQVQPRRGDAVQVMMMSIPRKRFEDLL